MSIRKQYDSDLEALKTALVEMGQNAAEAVENALEALCTADAVAAQKIVQGDDRINNMERDIEHRCMTLLLRQQPVAGDLRHISTAMKVVTDIERMGDHASDIAEIIPHLVTVRREGDPAVSQAIAMGRKAYQMILDAMDALTAEDEIAARRVIAADDAVPRRKAARILWDRYCLFPVPYRNSNGSFQNRRTYTPALQRPARMCGCRGPRSFVCIFPRHSGEFWD